MADMPAPTPDSDAPATEEDQDKTTADDDGRLEEAPSPDSNDAEVVPDQTDLKAEPAPLDQDEESKKEPTEELVEDSVKELPGSDEVEELAEDQDDEPPEEIAATADDDGRLEEGSSPDSDNVEVVADQIEVMAEPVPSDQDEESTERLVEESPASGEVEEPVEDQGHESAVGVVAADEAVEPVDGPSKVVPSSAEVEGSAEDQGEEIAEEIVAATELEADVEAEPTKAAPRVAGPGKPPAIPPKPRQAGPRRPTPPKTRISASSGTSVTPSYAPKTRPVSPAKTQPAASPASQLAAPSPSTSDKPPMIPPAKPVSSDKPPVIPPAKPGSSGKPPVIPPAKPAASRQAPVIAPTKTRSVNKKPKLSTAPPGRSDTKPKSRLLFLKVLLPLIFVGALMIGYVWLANNLADQVPGGTTVDGVAVGGLTKAAAVAKLEAELGPRNTQPVEVKVAGQVGSMLPDQAGLHFDAAATLAGTTGLSYNPTTLLAHFTGNTQIAPNITVDQDKLAEHLDILAQDTAVAPIDGAITVSNGEVETTDPKDGSKLDIDASVTLVSDGWFDASAPIELPIVPDKPDVDQAELDRAVSEIAEPLLVGPVDIQIESKTIELPETVLAEAATIAPIKGHLTLSLDDEVITAAVKTRLPEGIEEDARNAEFAFEGGKPVIVPGRAGRTVDFTSITAAVAIAAQSPTDRVTEVKVVDVDPTESENELAELGIKERVSFFETQAYDNWGRTENLKLAAKKVTGVLVRPGETFSLTKTLGPRTSENGWHEAGVVVAGVLGEGMGGGLSQFSTTLYNATFYAGLEDVEHQPHFDYFSRYPEVIEATLWEGEIDNRFKNDTPYGILINAWVSSELKVHVEYWSTKYWEVDEPVYSGRRNIVSAKTIEKPAGPGCTAQAVGSNGFTEDVTRTVRLDGVVQKSKTQTWTWTYAPTNGIKCVSPPKPKEDTKKKKN